MCLSISLVRSGIGIGFIYRPVSVINKLNMPYSLAKTECVSTVILY